MRELDDDVWGDAYEIVTRQLILQHPRVDMTYEHTVWSKMRTAQGHMVTLDKINNAVVKLKCGTTRRLYPKAWAHPKFLLLEEIRKEDIEVWVFMPI